MASASAPTDCPNCGRRLEGQFCAGCGQKASPLDPSLREFLHELFHELSSVDGKIVQSVRLLLTRPGFLSREHFEGKRARYIAPIRLYLLFSVLFFAVSAFAPGSAVRVTARPGAGDDPKEAELLRRERQVAADETLIRWAPRAMFLLVPVFGGLVAVAAGSSRRNFPQHLYFALHVHAAWFCAGAVAAASRIAGAERLSSGLAGAMMLYAAFYLVLAFRRAYDLTMGGAILRAAAVGGAYAMAVLATLAAIALPVVLRG
jgi:hypothetical protein